MGERENYFYKNCEYTSEFNEVCFDITNLLETVA